MANPLPFILAGVVTGAVYGLAAMGLALAYRLTRVLNFAHGAIAMFAGFTYWQLNVPWGWPAVIAVPVSVLLLPAVLALLTERYVFRNLRDASVFARTAATVALLLVFLGGALYLWTGKPVRPPSLFPKNFYDLPGVTASAEQIGIVSTVAVLSLAAFLVFRYTRIGTQLRAAVDNESLASMRGLNPDALAQTSWIASYIFAAVSGVLLAPLYGGDPTQLTLVVVFSLVALVIGRMESLPLTLAGGLIVGLADSLAIGYLPSGELTSRVRGILPFAILFAALVVLGRRLTSGGEESGDSMAWLRDTGNVGRSYREPGRRGIAIALVLTIVVGITGEFWSYIVATGVSYGIVFLSYKFFTSVTGMVSLAQAAFAGVGAFTAAYLMQGTCSGGGVELAVNDCLIPAFALPWPLAVLGGGILAGLFGSVVALPTVKLRGIILVLATVAFAQLIETVAFNQESLTGGTYGRALPRPPGFASDTAYLFVAVAIFLALGWVADRTRRSMVGRELQAYLGSDHGARSIGVRPERGRTIAFLLSAFIAGIGGAVLAGVNARVGVDTWNLVNALIWLTLTAIGGIASMWGALGAGVALALLPQVMLRVPELASLQTLLFGVLGLMLLRRPGGVFGILRDAAARLGALLRAPSAGAGPNDASVPRLVPRASDTQQRITLADAAEDS